MIKILSYYKSEINFTKHTNYFKKFKQAKWEYDVSSRLFTLRYDDKIVEMRLMPVDRMMDDIIGRGAHAIRFEDFFPEDSMISEASRRVRNTPGGEIWIMNELIWKKK